MARVAPEEQTRPLPANVFLTDCERTIMKFLNDPEIEISHLEDGSITMEQPNEGCPQCGHKETMGLHFSPSRAREIAKALLALADEVEAS